MKKPLIFSLIISIALGIYFLIEIYPFAAGVNEDALTGQFVKWNLKDIKEGDIIFQTSKSSQSKAIKIATKSKYSHMGIIYISNGDYFVYEATHIVKLTPLKEWILRGLEANFVVKRLKMRNRYLTEDNLRKMYSKGEEYKGKSYDLFFNWSDEQIYCSELVWKIYNSIGLEIGELQHLEDFDLKSKVVRVKLKERYGNKIPFKETVISPSSMYNSDLIETVISN